ncbi:MAG TPA: Gfo/Idh/MocA family oxidoreductase [Polyangiaceae bacterium]
MLKNYKLVVIGAGRPRGTDGATGFGMSHQHVVGFKATGRCELVAVADINRANADAFIREHNPEAKIYADYIELMDRERPDLVSVSLWPHLHAKVVIDVARFSPKAIHCEKPMDVDWDACLRMHEACEAAGVQLTFNHQRRFLEPFRRARALIDQGALGELRRMEAAWHNLADSGTHWLDMLFYFNGETPAEWVLAQVESRGARQVFGAWQESQGVSTFGFKNGVRATMYSGLRHEDLGCMLRVIGSRGTLEILDQAPWLRLHDFERGGWQNLDPGESIHDAVATTRAVQDLMDALESGRAPLLSSHNALRATEIIFAAYHSSLRRGRVDLPLAPERSALVQLLELGKSGTLGN